MRPPVAAALRVVVRFAARLRRFAREQTELQERLLLINRPWEQEILHWSADGQLHGRLVPDGRHGSGVTRGGWCACDRALSDEAVTER